MATVSGAIMVTWILNRFFLETYYIKTKVDSLANTFTTVSAIMDKYYIKEAGGDAAEAGSGPVSCAFTTKGSKNEASSESDTIPKGYGYYIEIDPSTDEENFLSVDDALSLEILASRSNLTIYIIKDLTYYFSTTNGNGKENVFFEKIRNELFPDSKKPNERLLEEKEGVYRICSVYDRRTSSTYIDLFSADQDKGNYILIRTNLESIKDSVAIANGFLLYAGMGVLIVTLFIIMVASRSIVRPLRQINSIAQSVSNLEFDVKYEGDADDEIGELGRSINIMSEKLEQTISDLKSANNALQTDIEEKTQIDEMRKEFLSNVTHELKTPIALISGYAEGLKDCINEDPESRDFYCDVIIDEADKMNKMVKKLLTLNQLEFGQQIIEMERFDISAMIRSVISSSDVLLKDKNIRLLLNVPETMDAWADEYMIEEVFTNYITNAINHCCNENIIDVKAEETETGIRVSVFNTGEPIPEGDIEKIWIKFYKVDKARSREYGGSGIGLSIVKAVMEAHNREYGVINHSNGVEFWFEVGKT
ncbi:MAG: HAMP domain-containing histidine kinase [Lachnospiraceae bacterium]|nr:HAMP domain-containing histidine kinase [Lachnospiraceae bacterium]